MDLGPAPLQPPAQQKGWGLEIAAGIAIAAWILYELYGREVMAWLSQYTLYIRIAGGIIVILYLWWQVRTNGGGPEIQDTLGAVKQLLLERQSTSGGGGTREKRNVTNLMKKTVAARQKWKCAHCSTLLDETFEVDHRLALFNGGSNDESNLEALCPHCHRKKTVKERLP